MQDQEPPQGQRGRAGEEKRGRRQACEDGPGLVSLGVSNVTSINWALPVLFSPLIKYICFFADALWLLTGQLILIPLPHLGG